MVDNPYELPKDLLHEVMIKSIEITNLSNRIIRSYFGMELKFGGEEEGWRVLNGNELNRFNDYFLENFGASSRADLLLEIKEELKKCKNFKNKIINFYKIRNIFAHNIYPKDLKGMTRLESSTPHWIELNKQHDELYKELKDSLESAINSV